MSIRFEAGKGYWGFVGFCFILVAWMLRGTP